MNEGHRLDTSHDDRGEHVARFSNLRLSPEVQLWLTYSSCICYRLFVISVTRSSDYCEHHTIPSLRRHLELAKRFLGHLRGVTFTRDWLLRP